MTVKLVGDLALVDVALVATFDVIDVGTEKKAADAGQVLLDALSCERSDLRAS